MLTFIGMRGTVRSTTDRGSPQMFAASGEMDEQEDSWLTPRLGWGDLDREGATLSSRQPGRDVHVDEGETVGGV